MWPTTLRLPRYLANTFVKVPCSLLTLLWNCASLFHTIIVMSEVSTRPSGLRGRGTSRGGRGSFSNRGGRGGSRATNGAHHNTTEAPSREEEGDIGELKSKYAGKIEPIKEMFPEWTEQDIAFALDETDGDLEGTVERISEGMTSFQLDPPTYRRRK